jgi:hypothetical protein
MSEICTMNYEGLKCLLRLIYSIQTVKVTWCFVFFPLGWQDLFYLLKTFKCILESAHVCLMITNARFHSER